jgi:hypothetical protein
MVRLNVSAEVKSLLSVTCTWKLAVVAVFGVPLMTPLLLRLNPDGRLPDTIDQL